MRILLPIATFVSGAAFLATATMAAEVSVDIHNVSGKGIGAKIGTVLISESSKGLKLKVDVAGIPPGAHGFHVHEKGDCAPGVKDAKETAALAAGAHYDPAGSKSHDGPQGEGHKGDLPFLTATDKGIFVDVIAPHLKLSDVQGRALVIHEGGDNYTNQPENGGGKGRIACGVIPKS